MTILAMIDRAKVEVLASLSGAGHEVSKMSDLTVVAIIPLYNGAKWIESAIGSILAQTLQPDEFIVVDDGSTDGGAGAAIVERLAAEHPQIRLLHKPNGGQSSARNMGVRHSRSDFIALLDQDDQWYPHHLERLIRPFQRDRRKHGMPLGWVYSDLNEIDEKGGLVHRNFLRSMPTPHPKTSLAACLSQDMFVLPSASLISRKAFESVNGFDERLCGYEDDDLFLRLFRAGYDNVFLDEPLSKWCIRPDSTSYTERMSLSRMIYAKKLIDSFPDDKSRNRYWVKHCIGPRFVGTLLGEYLTAIQDRDAKRMRRVISDLMEIRYTVRFKERLVLWLSAPFMRCYPLAKTALASNAILKAAMRLVS